MSLEDKLAKAARGLFLSNPKLGELYPPPDGILTDEGKAFREAAKSWAAEMELKEDQIGDVFKRGVLQGIFSEEDSYYHPRPRFMYARDEGQWSLVHVWKYFNRPDLYQCETPMPTLEEWENFPHLHNWPCKCGAVVWRLR